MSLLKKTTLFALAAGGFLSACVSNTGPDTPIEPRTFRSVGPIDGMTQTGTFLSWPGSMVATNFTGSRLDAIITDGGNAMLDVEINGTTTTIALEDGRFAYPIVDDAEGSYDVRLVLRSERKPSPILFAGFDPHDGTLEIAPPADLQMLVIGDSISTGYGVEGDSQDCRYSRETQNANLAFGAVAGRMLGADVTVIAASGRGLTRNWNDDERPTMRAIYNNLMLSDPPAVSSEITMDVVVVHLGTNDFAAGDPGVGFDRNYEDFLVRLRADHPSALLVAGWGPMGQAETYDDALSSIKGAVEARNDSGDDNVRFIRFANSPTGQLFGCDYHPSADTQFYMGSVLAAEIAEALDLDAAKPTN